MNQQSNRMQQPNVTTANEFSSGVSALMKRPEKGIECAVLPVNCPPCEGLGIRLYGSAMVDGVLCLYHPETDLLVPSHRWEEFIEKLREELDNKPEQAV